MSQSSVLNRPAGSGVPDVEDLERRGRTVARRVDRLRAQLQAALSERDDIADALITAGRSLSQTGRVIGGLCKERTRRAANAARERRTETETVATATAGAA